MPITKEQAGANVRQAGLTQEEKYALLAFINNLPPGGLDTCVPEDPASEVVSILRLQRGGGAGAFQAGLEPSYHDITFLYVDELESVAKIKFNKEIKRSKMLSILEGFGLFAIYSDVEAAANEDGFEDLLRIEDVEFTSGATYFAQLKAPNKSIAAYIRSMVDADEDRMAQRLVKHLQRANPTARRICQKEFQSIDKTIKVEIDVLIEDGDKLYVGEGKTRLGPDALEKLMIKLDKIGRLVKLDGQQGDAGVFSGKKLIPFLFGRTWVSSGVSKQARNRPQLEADLKALVEQATEQGVLVLFPDGEDLGFSNACFPGHNLSVPVTARNVCASASAPKQAPAATVMRGPLLPSRVQVRQQPVRYRMPPAHGVKPGGCKVGRIGTS